MTYKKLQIRDKYRQTFIILKNNSLLNSKKAII